MNASNSREIIENIESQHLSKYATLVVNTKGRNRQEEKCPIRTEFQRDRDRIIHCKAFRRLRLKTQVFLAPKGDHYRTRLTHTLEVSQIARTISRALRLNEDLTEAIALGHDVGHTPFGHAGERALREVCPAGFHHYQQSVRVLERYEKDGKGLNLTAEVIDGIRCHTVSSGLTASTLEGRVVKFADVIAYLNHDIEDAIRAGILTADEIPEEISDVLGRTKSQRITSLITSVIDNSGEDIIMGAREKAGFDMLHKFMFSTVYVDKRAKADEKKAAEIMKQLYFHLLKHPELLPQEYCNTIESDGIDLAVCDYIAGMSDSYCIETYNELFLPKAWSKY